MRVAVLVPYYRQMPTVAHYSLMRLQEYCFQKKIDSVFLGVDLTYIHEARNGLLKKFMEKHKEEPFDWVMHIDSDQMFFPHNLRKLIFDAEQKGFPILSGVYFSKEKGCGYAPVILEKQENENYRYISSLPTEPFFEADAVGFGFLLVRPFVYEQMLDTFGAGMFEYKLTKAGMTLGEDVVWCEKVKSLGFKVMVDRTVCIGHYGGVVGLEEHLALNKILSKSVEFKKLEGEDEKLEC